MKKEIYKIDADGFIIENHLGEFDELGSLLNPSGDFITADLPQPLPYYKPKWNGIQWTEGATQEEIEELTRVEPSPPTAEERIAMLEDTINFLLGL